MPTSYPSTEGGPETSYVFMNHGELLVPEGHLGSGMKNLLPDGLNSGLSTNLSLTGFKGGSFLWGHGLHNLLLD